jgi:hypothetical protein
VEDMTHNIKFFLIYFFAVSAYLCVKYHIKLLSNVRHMGYIYITLSGMSARTLCEITGITD